MRSNDSRKTDRRRFLSLVATSALVVPHLAACGGGASPAPVGTVPAGNVSDLPVGSLKAVGNRAVCIGRDDKGVYAMTLTCTHEGCNMAVNGRVSTSGIVCTCHSSTFDPQGNATGGPANDPLQHFAVSVDANGELTIFGDQNVGGDVRLAV